MSERNIKDDLGFDLKLMKTEDVSEGVESYIGVHNFLEIYENSITPIFNFAEHDAENVNYQRRKPAAITNLIKQRFLSSRDEPYPKNKIVDKRALIDNVNLNIRQASLSKKLIKPYNDNDKDFGETGSICTFSYHENLGPFYIVDGQGRMKGLAEAIESCKREDPTRYELLKNIQIKFTLTFTADAYDEAFIFYLLNKYSKPLPVDAALRILYNGSRYNDDKYKEEIELTNKSDSIECMELSDKLNEDTNSVWYKKITQYNEDNKTIKNVTMSKEILQPLYKYISNKQDPDSSVSIGDLTIKYFNAYWDAIRDIYPPCFGKNLKNYNIQQASSAEVMTILMLRILKECKDNENITFNLNPQDSSNWKEILQTPLENYIDYNKESLPVKGFKFWTVGKVGASGKYTNKSAKKELANNLYKAFFDVNINKNKR